MRQQTGNDDEAFNHLLEEMEQQIHRNNWDFEKISQNLRASDTYRQLGLFDEALNLLEEAEKLCQKLEKQITLSESSLDLDEEFRNLPASNQPLKAQRGNILLVKASVHYDRFELAEALSGYEAALELHQAAEFVPPQTGI